MSTFNPSRLRVARKRRLLNKTRFAKAIGVDIRTITGYERGEYEPSSATLALIAETLRFPVGFFAGDDLHEPVPATASFRSLARMSAANREAALASGALAFLLNDWIEKRLTLPAPDVPDLREEDPDAAAMALRQQWGLGERPVRNMVHLLEAKGVRVFTLFEDTTEVDAFSLWRATTPFVFLNTIKSAERSRFDAAHELGHLVLHRHAGAPQGREAEHEANRFASAFLMPRGSVFAVAPVFPSLDRLVALKRQWIVSVGAIAYRLHALGLLTDWHYIGSLNTTTRCHSVRSLRSPDALSFQVSLVASVKLTILLPACVLWTSGSLPRLPTRMTLLTEPAMSPSLSSHQEKASGSCRQRPLVCGRWEPDGGAGQRRAQLGTGCHAQSRAAAGRRPSMARTHPLT